MSRKKYVTPTTISDIEQQLKKIESALLTEFSPASSLLVDGVEKPIGTLANEVHDMWRTFAKPMELEAALHEATTERNRRAAAIRKFLLDLDAALETRLGRQSAKLENFGYRPRKTTGGGRRSKATPPAQPEKPEKGAEKPAA